MASLTPIDFRTISEIRMNQCCTAWPHQHEELISEMPIDLVNAEVLTDDRPVLELYNTYNSEDWRNTAIGAIIQREKENRIPFFR